MNLPYPGEVIESEEQAHALLSFLAGGEQTGLYVLLLDAESAGKGLVIVSDATPEQTDEVLTNLGIALAGTVDTVMAFHPQSPNELITQTVVQVQVA